MHRRMLLRSAALGGVGLVSGCTGVPSSGTPTGTDSPADSPSGSATGSPTEGPDSPTSGEPGFDRAFDVTNVECGDTGNSAEVSFDGTSVVVTGVARASDPCHRARLAADRTGVEERTLQVAVETYLPAENEDEVCAQCIADVDYQARFTFHEDLPDRVEVRHDGEPVAEADR